MGIEPIQSFERLILNDERTGTLFFDAEQAQRTVLVQSFLGHLSSSQLHPDGTGALIGRQVSLDSTEDRSPLFALFQDLLILHVTCCERPGDVAQEQVINY